MYSIKSLNCAFASYQYLWHGGLSMEDKKIKCIDCHKDFIFTSRWNRDYKCIFLSKKNIYRARTSYGILPWLHPRSFSCSRKAMIPEQQLCAKKGAQYLQISLSILYSYCYFREDDRLQLSDLRKCGNFYDELDISRKSKRISSR